MAILREAARSSIVSVSFQPPSISPYSHYERMCNFGLNPFSITYPHQVPVWRIDNVW